DIVPDALAEAPLGAVYEWRSDAAVDELCRRVATHGGAALIIDYGYAESASGDTLQAVRGHRFADPLAAPGEADLTAHVDFGALKRAAHRHSIATQGPLAQGEFLRRLGIEARADTLRRAATPAQAANIDAALARLTGEGAGQMGALFEAMAFAPPNFGPLPGFDPE
ncbi:MAG TPA: SAM-dependent methyltransferase, partial [Xanthobacteraceae bacterium]|nr:SAM-dependent methyltransferase [Xanthobacteraceae bacterium]